MSKFKIPKEFLKRVSYHSGSRYLNIVNPDLSSDIIDSKYGNIIIEDININHACEIKYQWNLQEYEGIDDTEGHL